MYYVTLCIYHDISIVPIFYLENIASDRIRRHGLNEIQACLLECNRILASVFSYEEVQQIIDFCAAHLITRRRIWNDVYNTRLVTRKHG